MNILIYWSWASVHHEDCVIEYFEDLFYASVSIIGRIPTSVIYTY